MKNVKFKLLIGLVAISALTFNACTTDDDTVSVKPKLNFLAGAGYTSADGDIVSGTEFTVGLSATHDSKIEIDNLKSRNTTYQIYKALLKQVKGIEYQYLYTLKLDEKVGFYRFKVICIKLKVRQIESNFINMKIEALKTLVILEYDFLEF